MTWNGEGLSDGGTASPRGRPRANQIFGRRRELFALELRAGTLEMTAPARRACPHCGTALDPNDRFCGTCGHPLAEASLASVVPLNDSPPELPHRLRMGRRILLITFWAALWGGVWAAAYSVWSLGGALFLLEVQPQISGNPAAFSLSRWTGSSLLAVFFVAGIAAGLVTATLSGHAAGWVKGAFGAARILRIGVVSIALLAGTATLTAWLFLDPSLGLSSAPGMTDAFPLVFSAGWIAASVIGGALFALLPRPVRAQTPRGFLLKTLLAWAAGALVGVGIVLQLSQV